MYFIHFIGSLRKLSDLVAEPFLAPPPDECVFTIACEWEVDNGFEEETLVLNLPYAFQPEETFFIFNANEDNNKFEKSVKIIKNDDFIQKALENPFNFTVGFGQETVQIENKEIDSTTREIEPTKKEKHRHHKKRDKKLEGEDNASGEENIIEDEKSDKQDKSNKHSGRHSRRRKKKDNLDEKESEIKEVKEKTHKHHKSRSSKSLPALKTSYIFQLDAHSLFINNKTRASITSSFRNYKSFTITVSISIPLLNDYFLKRFAPAFLYITKAESLPNEYKVFTINQQEIYINNTDSIDTVYCLSPRSNDALKFNIVSDPTYNKICGNGYIDLTKASKSKPSTVAEGDFVPLPERKRKVTVTSNDKSSIKSFFVVQSYDPAEEYGKPTIPDDPGEGEKALKQEPPSSQFYRWIFTSTKDASGIKFGRDLWSEIQSWHHHDTTSISYSDAIRRSYDVITGFNIETPDEHLFVLETRAQDPRKMSMNISEYIDCLPSSVRVIGDVTVSFAFPRMYTRFPGHFVKLNVPIPVADLLRIDGLYFRKAQYSSLFSVVQKIYDLFYVDSVDTASSSSLFPTIQEIALLSSKLPSLYTAPIKNYFEVQPPSYARISGSPREQTTLTKKTKAELITSRNLLASVDFQMRESEAAPVIVRPDSITDLRRRLSVTYTRRKINDDHKPFSVSLSKTGRMLASWQCTKIQRGDSNKIPSTPSTPRKHSRNPRFRK